MKTEEKNGYTFSRQWFEFVFKTTEEVRPIHTALYFWIVELNNRLQWKEVFGLPTDNAMQAIGINGYRHYKKALDDLIKWGFINLVSKSHNQHTCNQIAINLLYTLSTKQGTEQGTKQGTKQVPHSKTIETNPNSKNNKNPKEGEFIFFDSVITVFKEAWEEVNRVPYAIINEAQERNAAIRFIEIYRTGIPETDNEKLLEDLKPYFRAACSIKDPWLRSRMNFNTLVDKFNVINNTVKNREGRGYHVSDFEKVPSANKGLINEEGPTQPERLNPPTEMEVIEFFEVNGFTAQAAQAAHFNFERKGWRDTQGNCIIKKWQSIAKHNCFRDENRKR